MRQRPQKNQIKGEQMKPTKIYIDVLQKIDEIEHDYGYASVLGKYREEADSLLKKQAGKEEFKKLMRKVYTCKCKLKKAASVWEKGI